MAFRISLMFLLSCISLCGQDNPAVEWIRMYPNDYANNIYFSTSYMDESGNIYFDGNTSHRTLKCDVDGNLILESNEPIDSNC